nr:MAG TPA: hypothetical protein [Caudoviricetes sp.]
MILYKYLSNICLLNLFIMYNIVQSLSTLFIKKP